jgi:organic hydroperoxide reductase OsmC/OhrA
MKQHVYKATIRWTGNSGRGTSDYTAYSRDHIVSIAGKPDLLSSSDPVFRGDASRYNPEDLLVASLSGCHMLWYLHLCAVNKVVVIAYQDDAEGSMRENADGSGEFAEVMLRPRVKVKDAAMQQKALELHEEAHRFCFIARSVNFPVKHQATIIL